MELYRFNPPTALIFQEAALFNAARICLADRGIIAPRDVSLIVIDEDPSFPWCSPPVSHIRWDQKAILRRVMRWAKNVARGKEDRRQMGIRGEFIEGGTIGPVPKGS